MKNFKSFLIVVPVIAICGIVAFSLIPSEKKEVIQSAQPLVVEKKESANEIPVDTFYNNITQLIGGNDTVLSYNPKWDLKKVKEYAKKVSSKTKRIEGNRLMPLMEWNKSNLERNKTSDSSFAFYPFSGGDFIHLNWLYPNATEYLLVAREDVGSVPNLLDKNTEAVLSYLNDVDFVLRDIYSKSYFITKNMSSDTKVDTQVNGMLPVILWAISRTNHEVLSLNYKNIDSTGFAVEADLTKGKPSAVVISVRHKVTRKIKRITYLSCDISDKGFKSKPNNFTFLSNTIPAGCNSFVKSASYLLHYDSFKQIRDFILDISKFLVQDDTGIPYKHFNAEKWTAELFGTYVLPVKDFSENLFQNDLLGAYKSDMYKGPLKFSLGYHWGGQNRQNQMVFIKH
jgi:hypothetical protein